MHIHVMERIKPGTRVAGPESIELPSGYAIEAVATDLNFPTSVSWDPDGNMLIAESRFPYGQAAPTEVRILRRNASTGSIEPVIAGFEELINDITVYRGMLYVSHRGKISVVEDGRIRDLIADLPSWGLHQNNTLVFGRDERMYFGQGTVSNAGVLGPPELRQLHHTGHLQGHDIPGADVILAGQNFASTDPATHETRATGAFLPWAWPASPGQRIEGAAAGRAASGAIMSANPDGTDLRVHAWGFSDPFGLVFGPDGRLYVTNRGAKPEAPRPIAGDPDTLWVVEPGVWYGWPDYFAGLPVTDPQFQQPGLAPHEFLITNHHELLGGRGSPPKPLLDLGQQVTASKLDFCLRADFGFANQAFVAQFGPLLAPTEAGVPCSPAGHRVVRIDLAHGTISDLAVNRSRLPASLTGNNGGLERPIEAKFGPDGSLYIVDLGVVEHREEINDWQATPGTGIVWRVAPKSG